MKSPKTRCTVASPVRGVPGAQVDWGDAGDVLAHVGVPNVYSSHMVLSYSPFTCFTTSMNLATFFDCHRRASDKGDDTIRTPSISRFLVRILSGAE